MQALIWVLIALDALVVAACVRLDRRRGRDAAARPARVSRRMALALAIAPLLPLPVLLSTNASAAAWALWGTTLIAAGLTWAVADTRRAAAAPPASGPRSTP